MKEKTEKEFTLDFILLSFFLLFLIYFFLSVSYKLNIFTKIIFVLICLIVFFYTRKLGIYSFSLALIVGVSTFLSLEISFNISLSLLLIYSLFGIFLTQFFYLKFKDSDKYPIILFFWFLVIWIIIGFNVSYRSAWLMENYLTVPFLTIIFLLYRKIKFSNLSYSLIFVYLFLHIIGSHYTYSEVPFGFWMQSFFSLGRNHYDRIVHFCFGFLLAYPLGEFFEKISKSKGFWSLYIPIEFVLAFSAIFEITEWIIATIFGGDLGVAYLGSQGDVWDAQKDMALAGIGALLAMFSSFLIKLYYSGKNHLREIKNSLKIN